MKDLEGKDVSLAGYKGKVVLLNFWATWCGPCRAEIPGLIDLQNKYKEQLQIIGMDIDDSLLNVSEKGMLEDLLAAAFNDARAKADAASQEAMSHMTAGLPLPPGFKLPF